MLKGKSEIQLFDAVSGKEIYRQTNNNMLTNAVKNILNVPLEYGYDVTWRKISEEILPLKTKGLGGVLIWDSEIPENPNIIFAPKGVGEVGHAGGAYDGANPYRGTYNTAESGEISGGYRHVWDFATDRANGTIKCLSLTSIQGGNCGLHVGSDNISVSKSIAQVTPGISGVLFAGCISQGKYVGYNKSTCTLCCYSYLAPSRIDLNFTTSSTPQLIEEKTFNFPAYAKTADIFVSLDGIMTLYYLVSSSTPYKLWYADISLNSGEILAQKEIEFQAEEIYTNSRWYTIGATTNSIYISAADKTLSAYKYVVLEFDREGNLVRRIPNLVFNNPLSGSKLFKIGNKLYFRANYNLVGIDDASECLSIEQIGTAAFSNVNSATYNQAEISPFVLHPCSGTYGNSLFSYLSLFYPYLGTINNLAEPIIKTSAQTMKITYEITNI